MNEDFVPFELAKKLKEKWFRELCLTYYTNDDTLYYNYSHKAGACYKDCYLSHNSMPKNSVSGKFVDAPTISQVLKWLREEKAISVEPYASASGWRLTICRAYHQDRCDAGGGTCLKEEVIGYNDGGAFEKYEEAALAGIEYVLDNLI